jgi:hypothetical protein
MGVTVSCGQASHTFGSLVGKSVTRVRSDETVAELLGLNGNESVRVNGATVNNTYVLRNDDNVVFSRVAGEKGLLA